MSLKDVKNMGTEGRRNGVNELPASENILGMVKFRVDLVKTFKIIEKPQEEKQDTPEEEGDVDPAIISSTEPEKAPPKAQRQPKTH